LPNVLEQRARPLLNRLVVVRDELEHGALGSVVYDTDYLIADLIAASLRSARDHVIGAGMIIGFVFRRNVASVGPSFILALVSGLPDLFRTGKDYVERVGCRGGGRRGGARPVVFARQVCVDAARRPDAERIEAGNRHQREYYRGAVERVARLVNEEEQARGERRLNPPRQFAAVFRQGRIHGAHLFEDRAVAARYENPAVKPRPFEDAETT